MQTFLESWLHHIRRVLERLLCNLWSSLRLAAHLIIIRGLLVKPTSFISPPKSCQNLRSSNMRKTHILSHSDVSSNTISNWLRSSIISYLLQGLSIGLTPFFPRCLVQSAEMEGYYCWTIVFVAILSHQLSISYGWLTKLVLCCLLCCVLSRLKARVKWHAFNVNPDRINSYVNDR